MRIELLLLIGAASVMAQSSNATPSAVNSHEKRVLEECGAYSQAEMRECLAKKSRESAAALRRAETLAYNAISHWDEDAKYIAVATEKLKSSRKAHENYLDAHCALAYSLGGGSIGNALEMRRLACVFSLNSMRTEQLTAAVSRLPQR